MLCDATLQRVCFTTTPIMLPSDNVHCHNIGLLVAIRDLLNKQDIDTKSGHVSIFYSDKQIPDFNLFLTVYNYNL